MRDDANGWWWIERIYTLTVCVFIVHASHSLHRHFSKRKDEEKKKKKKIKKPEQNKQLTYYAITERTLTHTHTFLSSLF